MQPPALPDSAAGWALFLDFDGTLVDIAPRPDAVVLEGPLREALARLTGQCGLALAIVSGRPIAEIDRFLEPLVLPIAGVHGQEMRLADGRRIEAAPDLDLAPVRDAMRALAASHPALLVEDKGHALALHTRAAPELAPLCRDRLQALVANDPDLLLLEGHCVFEVKAAEVDKGVAVRRFMAEPPFRGRRPLFAGDDRTDEDGIRVAQELGGLGVRIGGSETQALLKLKEARQLRSWLLAQSRCAS